VKGQPEKMSLEPRSIVTMTDRQEAKVKRQWVPDNWSCDEKAPPSEPSCSGLLEWMHIHTHAQCTREHS